MRVLHVIPLLGIAGAERIVASLALHQRRAGHTAGVVSLFGPQGTWLEAELASRDVPVFYLGKRSGLDVRVIPRIAAAARRFRPDLVHTHLGVLKYVLPAFAIARRCPVVHTLHNLARHEVERPSRAVHHLAFRAGVVPVAIGENVAASVRAEYGLSPRRIIPNGISVRDYAPDPAARGEVRERLGLAANAPTFLAVGRLTPAKDPGCLLRAFASRRLRTANAQLLFAGVGPLLSELRRQAVELDVADRVRFLGLRRDVPLLLAAADAFVLASRWEGNPLCVMEAMAAAKPVVATKVGCVPELVSEETGLLVSSGDHEALEEAMHRLATDPRLASAKGAAAARVARERFDDSVMARAYEDLYRELLTSRGHAEEALAPGGR
jgi:glycosyltransferase involved in cell wall biosynthesis